MTQNNTEQTNKRLSLSVNVWLLLACALVFALLDLMIYSGSLAAGPLLDEQYFIGRFLQEKSQAANLFNFCTGWHGFTRGDSSGPLAALGHMFFLKNIILLRFCGMFLHWVNSLLIVALVSHSGKNAARLTLSVIAGLIFLVYPLAAETVFYLASPTYSLSTCFFLASFLFFLESRERTSVPLLGLSSLLFIFSVLIDRSSWITSFVFLSYEIIQMILRHKPASADSKPFSQEDDAVDKLLEFESARAQDKADEEKSKDTPASDSPESTESAKHPVFDGLVPVVPFVLIGCIVPLGALPTMGTETLSKDLTVNFQDWFKAAQVLFLPVNWNHHTGTSRYYTFLVALYIFPVLSLLAVLFKHKHLRFNMGWLLVWILVTLVPHLHVYTHSDSFAGCRWFYHCLVPLSLILATAFVSPYILISSWQKNFLVKFLAFAASGIPLLLYLFYVGNISYRDILHYRSGARQTKVFQTSLKNLAERESSNFVLVRNLPDIVSVHPMVSLFNLSIFDGQTALMSAPDVSGGKLKKLLNDDKAKLKTVTTHFEPDYKALVACDMMKTPPEGRLQGALFLEALTPPASYWKTGTYDNQNNEFTFYSNNSFRPTINFQSNIFGISTDFIYVDAQINAPKSQENLTVDMGWITTWCKDLETRDRFMKVKAFVNDEQYHRYYFPTDSTGWSTNGYIKQLTFSFPSSAKVKIKELGCIQVADLKPQLQIKSVENNPVVPGNSDILPKYNTDYCYEYPVRHLNSLPDLGLCRLDDKEIELEFDASNVKGAQKIGLEYTLCEAGKKFQPHEVDTYHQKLTGKKIVNDTKGSIKIGPEELAKPGFYAFRLFAENGSGQTVGVASDTIFCLSQVQKGAKK